MSSSVLFIFQANLSKDTPKWLVEALQAMVAPDGDPEALEKIMELSRGSFDKFFHQPNWEGLLVQRRDPDWPKQDAPLTRFFPELDEDGKLVRWCLYGCSSYGRYGWDNAQEFAAMIGPYLEPEHDLTSLWQYRDMSGVQQPFMLAQDDVPLDADRPQMAHFYRCGGRSLMQHRSRDFLDDFSAPTLPSEAHRWKVEKAPGDHLYRFKPVTNG